MQSKRISSGDNVSLSKGGTKVLIFDMRRTVGSTSPARLGSSSSILNGTKGLESGLQSSNVLPQFRVAPGDVSTRVEGPAGVVAAKETAGADV